MSRDTFLFRFQKLQQKLNTRGLLHRKRGENSSQHPALSSLTLLHPNQQGEYLRSWDSLLEGFFSFSGTILKCWINFCMLLCHLFSRDVITTPQASAVKDVQLVSMVTPGEGRPKIANHVHALWLLLRTSECCWSEWYWYYRLFFFTYADLSVYQQVQPGLWDWVRRSTDLHCLSNWLHW